MVQIRGRQESDNFSIALQRSRIIFYLIILIFYKKTKKIIGEIGNKPAQRPKREESNGACSNGIIGAKAKKTSRKDITMKKKAKQSHLPTLEYALTMYANVHLSKLEACHRDIARGADLTRTIEGKSAAWVRRAAAESLRGEKLAATLMDLSDAELLAHHPYRAPGHVGALWVYARWSAGGHPDRRPLSG